MRKIGFLPDAEKEMFDAIVYYDNEAEGLGDEFFNDIQSAVQKIQRNPESWAVIEDGIRKFLIVKFPYKILYMIDPDTIVIIAVAHHKRKPGYWRSRI